MPKFGPCPTCGFRLFPLSVIRPFAAVEGAIVLTEEADILDTDAWCDNCQKVVTFG